MATSAPKDFFVSYNHHDTAWAEWIAWQVEAQGYSVVIQAWDFRPGSNFVLDMQAALSGADRVIVVLSENFFNSAFTQPEWAAIFADDPMGQAGKLLPIRVGQCNVRGLLKPLTYIDLVGKTEEKALQELIAGLFIGRAKPVKSPTFPAQNGPEFPNPLGAISCEPIPRKRYSIVLSGTFDGLSKSTVEALMEHMKQIIQDPTITLLEIRPGSIRLIFDGAEEGFQRIRRLFETKSITRLGGLRILKVERIDWERSEAEKAMEAWISQNVAESLTTAHIHLKEGASRSKFRAGYDRLSSRIGVQQATGEILPEFALLAEAVARLLEESGEEAVGGALVFPKLKEIMGKIQVEGFRRNETRWEYVSMVFSPELLWQIHLMGIRLFKRGLFGAISEMEVAKKLGLSAWAAQKGMFGIKNLGPIIDWQSNKDN